MKVLKRLVVVLLVVLFLVVAGPPLLYAVVPYDWPELPPAGRRISVGDGLSVNAIERGEGPSVVLVHGLPGTAQDWDPLIDALARRGRRVIAYDRIGYGRSDGRPGEAPAAFTVAANARELHGLIRNEGLQDVTLVGWSYGGPISIEAALLDAAEAPSRIARLVLVGTAGPDSDDAEPPPPPGLVATAILRWVGAVPPAGAALQRVSSEMAFSEQPQPDWWETNLAANFAAPHTRLSWASEGAAIGLGGEFRAHEVGVPALVIHGDDDRLVPLTIGEYVDSKLPDSRLEVVENGSHMLPITHADRLADWIVGL